MIKALAVRLTDFGSTDVLKFHESMLPAPDPGHVQLRQTAIGFNYIDVYQRTGKYPLPTPTGLGHEAAGVVTAVGEGVTDLLPGDRVVYINAGIGAYATHRNVPAERVVSLPDGLDDASAAAMFFKAMTVQYLIHKTYRVGPDDVVLVHAAAGGVGQILSAWSKSLGAKVIGTAGSAIKCEQALHAGCDVAVNYSDADWVAQVVDATDGKKATVVYDSVGRHTFLGSLDCARQFGHVVVFGAASGPIPPFDVELLNKKGGLYLTRPSVFPHNADVQTFRENARMVFDAYSKGIIRANIGARFALSDVAQAHAAAEARSTSGAIVMLP
jgi:NADPH2:quinone reductase